MAIPTKKVHIIEKTASLPFAVFSNEQRKKRVAAYARVSTEQDEQQSSYEAQVDFYTRHIKNNPEWEFVEVYTDATVIIGLKQNPTYGRRFSPIFLRKRAFCGAKRKMLL